jgi:hypothetical protein
MNLKKEYIIIIMVFSYESLSHMNMKEIKQICKERKIKRTGKKKTLIDRIMNAEYNHSNVVIIQKYVRRYLVQKYMNYKGNIEEYTNDEDFLTLDAFTEIPFHDRYAYKDESGFIYAFHIRSIMQLIERNDMKNPYTRMSFPKHIKKEVRSMIRIARLLRISLDIHYETPKPRTIQDRIQHVFMEIERYGYLLDAQSFHNLHRFELVHFYKEMYDIWNYRLNLTLENKRNIVAHDGNLFRNIPRNISLQPTSDIREYCVRIIERLITKANDNSFKQMGIMYALGALTLVNRNFAETLPWLFESFRYTNTNN